MDLKQLLTLAALALLGVAATLLLASPRAAPPEADPLALPFPSKYVTVDGARMHYVEAGAGDPILFLHGQPTSAYLWRNVLPHAAQAGRAIALDLVGFGRSDKPDIDYRFFDHARYLAGFIEALDLRNLTLVVHDWGSALGFDYARRHPERIRAIAMMEAMLLPIPGYDALPEEVRQMMQAFRDPDTGWDLIVEQNMFIEKLLPSMVMRPLTPAEMDAYRAPFAQAAWRKPVWRWPNELPIGGEPADVHAMQLAYLDWLQRTEVPLLLLLHVTPGALGTAEVVAWAREHLSNLTTVHLGPGLHFVQEDHPDAIGRALVDWLRGLR